MKKLGAVILAGGESSRMGSAKSRLVLNEVTFLEILISRFRSLQIPIVVVGAFNEDPWKSFPKVTWLKDRREGLGPLEGIRVGLEYLQDKSELAFVTACDSPLLKVELVEFLAAQAENYQAVIPQSSTRTFGLTAVYRTDVHSLIEAQIKSGEQRVQSLSRSLRSRLIPLESLTEIDPDLVSFENINTPDDYQRLIKKHSGS